VAARARSRHRLQNGRAIAAHARDLAGAVGAVLDAGEAPLVLGGDCSIVLGSLLALRRRGRHGLLFLDGHADFADPADDEVGEAASCDLALATGRGPAVLADLDGAGPLVRDADVALLGYRVRDDGTDRHGATPVEATGITAIDLPALRTAAAAASAERALGVVARPELDGFWLHLDADVLDDDLVPAVDYRSPGGLGWEELATILRAARATGRLTGAEVTILNPRLDPTGAIVRRLADTLVTALR
jgi:arginase